MNNWLIPALLSPLIDTIINFTDKFIVVKGVKDYMGVPIFTAIIGAITGFFIFIVSGFPLLSVTGTLIVLTTGIFIVWGLALYYKVLAVEETSRVIVYFKLIPVIILILSYLILKETLSIRQFAGFIFVMGAVLGISLKQSIMNKGKKIRFTSLILIVIVDLLWSISAVLMKFALEANTFSKILCYESWGVGIGGTLLYIFIPGVRRGFAETVRHIQKRTIFMLIVNETLYIFSKGLTYFAYSLGPAALVSVIGGTQVFYGIVMGTGVSILAPKIFTEDTSRKEILRKLYYISILLFGIWLLG